MAASSVPTRSTTTVFILLLLGLLLAEAPVKVNALTCSSILRYVAACIPYVRGPGGQVPSKCCSGLRTAAGHFLHNTNTRRIACRCLKLAAGGVQGTKPALVKGLPSRCGIFLPFKISPYTNCNRV